MNVLTLFSCSLKSKKKKEKNHNSTYLTKYLCHKVSDMKHKSDMIGRQNLFLLLIVIVT